MGDAHPDAPNEAVPICEEAVGCQAASWMETVKVLVAQRDEAVDLLRRTTDAVGELLARYAEGAASPSLIFEANYDYLSEVVRDDRAFLAVFDNPVTPEDQKPCPGKYDAPYHCQGGWRWNLDGEHFKSSEHHHVKCEMCDGTGLAPVTSGTEKQ